MTETNILFLAPNWRVSLINAFRETKKKINAHGKLTGADSDPRSPALRVMDFSHTIPPFPEPGCIDAVVKICRSQAIHAIIPMTNKAIEFLDANRNSLQSEILFLYIQTNAVIETCHDKLRLAEFCNANDIPAPKTISPDAPYPGFPLIAKPRRGEGGKNCFPIKGSIDLEYYSGKLTDPILQEFINGREFSIDWFSDRNGKPLVIVPRERLAVRGGEVMVSRIDMDKHIIEAAKTAGTRLGLRGPCTLQGILEPSGRFIFTDINLRFGSGSVHTINAGGDVPAMIYKELAGEIPTADPDAIKDGSVMTRYPESIYL